MNSVFLAMGLIALGQAAGERPASDTRPDSVNQARPGVDIDRQGRPEVSQVTRASKLIGRRVVSATKQPLGTVQELILDLATGHLAALVIDAGDPTAPQLLLLPPQVVQISENALVVTKEISAKARKQLAAENLTAALNKQKLAAIYPALGVVAPAQADSAEAAQNEVSEIELLSQVRGTSVVNQDEQALGTVEDLAIDLKTGIIAYAALDCPDRNRECFYPVPLPALVAQIKKAAWVLELPEEIFAKMPTISREQWPEKINRGWVEYIHVRYGRSPFGGVRSALRAESTGKKSRS